MYNRTLRVFTDISLGCDALLRKNILESASQFLKFKFIKKATKINKIFTVHLTLCSKCQMDGEDFINFLGLLRKHEL